MPQRIRNEIELLLGGLEAAQPEWRTTLEETQRTVEAVSSASQELQETAIEFDRTVSTINQAAVALEKTANAVTITAQEIQKFFPQRLEKSPLEAAAKSRGEPFSFQAVTTSALAVSETAEKMRVLLADLRETTESDAVSQQLENTVNSATVKMKGLVDHIALRAGQLLILLFILAIAYRFIAARVSKKKTEL
jgi:hypothetical protein